MNTPPRPIRMSMPPVAPGRGRPPPIQIPNTPRRNLGVTFNGIGINHQTQMNPGGSPGPRGTGRGGRRKTRKMRNKRKTRRAPK